MVGHAPPSLEIVTPVINWGSPPPSDHRSGPFQEDHGTCPASLSIASPGSHDRSGQAVAEPIQPKNVSAFLPGILVRASDGLLCFGACEDVAPELLLATLSLRETVQEIPPDRGERQEEPNKERTGACVATRAGWRRSGSRWCLGRSRSIRWAESLQGEASWDGIAVTCNQKTLTNSWAALFPASTGDLLASPSFGPGFIKEPFSYARSLFPACPVALVRIPGLWEEKPHPGRCV